MDVAILVLASSLRGTFKIFEVQDGKLGRIRPFLLRNEELALSTGPWEASCITCLSIGLDREMEVAMVHGCLLQEANPDVNCLVLLLRSWDQSKWIFIDVAA